MKQIIKIFNNLIKKTILKVKNKTNINFKIDHLNIIKNFNKSIEKIIFKVQNKTSLKLPVSKFNKYLITLISLLFFYIFYLLIPILYDKNWVQKNIEDQLLENFKMHFSLSSDISYRILPAPHYLIKDSKILNKIDKTVSLANIKTLKVFVSQKNFFNKEKVSPKYIKINNADFILLNGNLKLLKDSTKNKFSNKIIEINKSNIFFKDDLGETISTIIISKAFLFHDDGDLLNLFELEGEIFNIPFSFDYKRMFNSLKTEEINVAAKVLKLNIYSKHNDNSGKSIISFLYSKINTDYKINDDDVIVFNSTNSRIKNTKIDYSGELSINPFDLDLEINLDDLNLRKVFLNNNILKELIKTELLFNKNISINTSINTNFISKNKIFQNGEVYLNITNGKFNINKTRLINKKIGLIELQNSNLGLEKDRLILNTDIIVDIKNSNKLFSLLQTNKKFRKPIKKIFINLDYDFLSNKIKFNNIKIENKEINDGLSLLIDDFYYDNLNNWNQNRRLLNILFENYEG